MIQLKPFKHLKLLLLIAFTVALSHFDALAYDFEVDDIYYNQNGNEASVTFRDENYNSYSGDVEIPETVTYNGTTYSVTSIGENAFDSCTDLTSVSIPNSVTLIGYRAFSSCGLASVTIPEFVTSIRDSAFSNCTDLTSVTIPNSIAEISEYAFESCYGLTSVTVENPNPANINVGYGVFGDVPLNTCTLYVPKGSKELYRTTNPWSDFCHIKEIGNYFDIDGICYDIISNIEVAVSGGIPYSGDIEIPETVSYNGKTYSVISIGDSAFSGCRELTSVIIPNSVTSIEYRAFYECSGLSSLTIENSNPDNISLGELILYDVPVNTCVLYVPNGSKDLYYNAYPWSDFRHIKEIGNCFEADGIFYDIISDTEVVVGGGITYSGHVVIPETVSFGGKTYSVTSIGAHAFYGCSGLTSINIPSSVTSIGGRAFYECTGLTSVSIPNSVTSLGHYAFSKCSNMTEVTIPNSVEQIEVGTFSYCSSLTEVTIPSSVSFFGEAIFAGCTGLTSVSLPNSFSWLGDQIFYGCSNLKEINIPTSVTIIGNYAFFNCTSLVSVTIPESIKSLGIAAFAGCDGLSSFYGKFASDDHRCLIVDGVLKAFAPAGLTEYSIPNSVTSIDEWAFAGYSSLTEVNIPNSVTSIGYAAFYQCSSLKEVTIPNSVTKIGSSVFQDCSGLTSVSLSNSLSSIADQAFYMCGSLTSITIPNSVTSIGNFAFYGCIGLNDVAIPVSVTNIGEAAFAYGYGLTSVTIENPDPDNISLGDNVFYNVPTNTCTLYVPKGSKELYRATNPWSDFVNIEEKESGAEEVPGDFDGNGSTSVEDLQMVINSILSPTSNSRFDLNGDGVVNAADIVRMIDIIMGR